tara:strand:+ start:123 stop:2276 length:2154 start_codon:yes stop_codon:yes gene_type:complete
MKKFIKLFLILVFPISSFASDYGVVGLVDTPTARMRDDGTLTTSTSWQPRGKSFHITYQITPWLEGTFKYTGFNYYFEWDRNFEMKARLFEETEKLPEIAIGIRDITGTGYFTGEYLAASKQFGNLDVTLGLGWGRLAGDYSGQDGDFKNPLSLFGDRFSSRDYEKSGGGRLAIDSFFGGEQTGIFGGMSYKSSSYPLTYMIEYNPDGYQREVARGGVRPPYFPKPKSPISTAIKWDVTPGISMTFSHQHLDEWGFNIAASLDSKSLPEKLPRPKFISSLDLKQNQLPPFINKNKWYDTLLFDVERSGILLIEASIDNNTQTATIVMGNTLYLHWSDALAIMIDLADKHLPKSVTKLNIVIEEEGHRLHTVSVARSTIGFENSREIIQENIEIIPTNEISVPQYQTNFANLRRVIFDYNVAFRTQLFDPQDPARYQWYAKLGLQMNLPNSWTLRGIYNQNIYQNFDESNRSGGSRLPPVRTDVVYYLKGGTTGLDSLTLQKRGNVNEDIYFRLYGGILEQMFSGVGGEILYHPFQSRFSYGLSANYVKRRDFDRSFKHLKYETATAFASIYYASPFYNLDFAVHAGKYLAKDVGATFEARRTFPNGWSVGLWATFTDVSYVDFGEGSFDKGLFFNIPLSTYFGPKDRNSFRTYLRPIQRDGGQRIEDYSSNLWWDIRNARYDAFLKIKNRKFLAGFSTKKKTSSDQNILKKYYKEKR